MTSESLAAPVSGKAALADVLRRATYEILPFESAEGVLAHVPRDVSLTVTTTEAKGLGPTVDLAARLGSQGYRAAPPLAARLVRDHSPTSSRSCVTPASTACS